MKLSRVKLSQLSPWARKFLWNKLDRVCDWDGIHRGLSSAVSTGTEHCMLDSCSINPRFQEPRVIIIGAGIAGLSAAHRLTQCGIRNFVVLEAKERFA